MKKYYYIFLFLTFGSCKEELVKWKFSSKPTISNNGFFQKSGLIIREDIDRSSIIKEISKNEEFSDLIAITLDDARFGMEILNEPNLADSLRVEIFCDAIPLLSLYKDTIKIEPKYFSGNLSSKTVKLLGAKLEVISLLNPVLQEVVLNGRVIKFICEARTIPSGKLINGKGWFNIHFNAVITKCVKKPEFTVFSENNLGLCE